MMNVFADPNVSWSSVRTALPLVVGGGCRKGKAQQTHAARGPDDERQDSRIAWRSEGEGKEGAAEKRLDV